MQVDQFPFPVNTIDLHNTKVLVRPEQADSTKGKKVIISEERPKSLDDKIWSREVVLEKVLDGNETLKITVKAYGLGGKSAIRSKIRAQSKSVRPIEPTG